MATTQKLARPINAHGELVAELTYREPIARDFKEFKMGDETAGNWIPLIAALAAVPPSSIETMHPSDLFKAIELIGPLLLPPPPIGATS